MKINGQIVKISSLEKMDSLLVSMEKAEQNPDGTWSFVDMAGNKIVVDLEDGRVGYEISNGERFYFGTNSKKENGYTYASVGVLVNGLICTPLTGNHVIVCALNNIINGPHSTRYDNIIRIRNFLYQDYVVCHKNNCPFDNRASNLEYGSRSINTTHGFLVKAIHEKYPYKYTDIIHNGSGVDFIVLKNFGLEAWMVKHLCEKIKKTGKYGYRHFNKTNIDIILDEMHKNKII